MSENGYMNKIDPELLKKYIGTKITDDTKENINKTLAEFLSNYSVSKPLVKSESAWKTMNFFQKSKWFWCNKITNKAKKFRKVYYENLKYLPENVPLPEMPLWAIESPKSVLMVDAYIKPHKPVEQIELTLTIQNNDQEFKI